MSYYFPPLPYFIGFTAFAPEVPKLYWNVKSQEQRILEICKHLDKLINYADMLAQRINDLDSTINEEFEAFKAEVEKRLDAQDKTLASALQEQDEKVAKELSALRAYVDERFDQIATSMLIYDVTTGTYRNSIEAMRRMYSALAYSNTGSRALVSEMATNMTVSQLSAMTVYHAAWSERDTIVIDDQIPTTEGID